MKGGRPELSLASTNQREGQRKTFPADTVEDLLREEGGKSVWHVCQLCMISVCLYLIPDLAQDLIPVLHAIDGVEGDVLVSII